AVSTLSYFKTFVIFSILRILRRADVVEACAACLFRGAGHPPHGGIRASSRRRGLAPRAAWRRVGAGRCIRVPEMPPPISCIRDRLLAGNGAGAPSGRLHGAKFVRGACRPFPRYPRAPACPARSVRPVL